MTITSKIQNRPSRAIVCLRYVGPFGPAIGEFWAKRVMPWREARGLLTCESFGISRDDPCDTPPEHCRYDAGVAVPFGFVAEGEEIVSELPAGPCVVGHYFGTAANIGTAWDRVISDVTRLGRAVDPSLSVYEHYHPDGRFDETTGAFECELVVPVVWPT